jgi:hypothetical protein
MSKSACKKMMCNFIAELFKRMILAMCEENRPKYQHLFHDRSYHMLSLHDSYGVTSFVAFHNHEIVQKKPHQCIHVTTTTEEKRE